MVAVIPGFEPIETPDVRLAATMRDLPSEVVAPLDFRPLRREAAICFSVRMRRLSCKK